MSLEIYIPASLPFAAALLMSWRQPRMHPAWTARILAVLIGATVLAVLCTLLFAILAAVTAVTAADAGIVGDFFLEHGPVPMPVAVVAALALCAMTVAGVRTVLRQRADLRHVRNLGTGVVADERPFAAALPGRDGGVILSTGLVRLLTGRELEVVLRHEAAHIKHRHHLYLMFGALAARIVPALAGAHRALRLALERWADEDAAEAVGDRALTARTIARVALANPAATPAWYPGAADFQVARRVQALLRETPPDNRITGPVLLSGAWMATGSAISPTFSHYASFVLLLV
ncbi:Zn-dependent protease with chaperone function [Thermocatellispora tengchongensis]|uniref:Zn-dependent protease with chaperone function n=1 Tax=Thermocatellispora tengchongensis TaxID=1073253 RepID=A0A840PFL4_9ACTN|nr:M56 family metallopeptidase [Thermocatellispora tengchongensis]MBB5138378.1 Zn-dependent protease with chaperone function [Thermocatellispora tengchongensis]